MRVLVVTQYFWPENFRVNDLVCELVKRGHEVSVLTGKPNYPSGKVFEDFLRAPNKFSTYRGAKIFRTPMMARAQGAARLLLNYLSFAIGASICGGWLLRRRDFDVIFVYEPSPVTVGLPAVLLGRFKRIPIVFWVLDLWPETLSAIGVVRSPRVLGWIGKMVSFIYNHCTLVLGQSQGFLASISKYCIDPQKVRYFPSWAEDVFNQKNTPKASEISMCDDCFNVLFAGNVGEAQDLPAVLDAADRLKDNPNIRWLIVGDGRKSDWLQSEVKRRRLQERVFLLGRFPVERMPSFYAHADALLVSLKKDPVFSMTIPGKVQSYLMSGLPLLGMLDGEGARVIEQAGAGFTSAAGDSAGLAATVLRMANMSAEERLRIGANGRAYADKEFSREMLMNRFEEFLKEAISISYDSKNKKVKQ